MYVTYFNINDFDLWYLNDELVHGSLQEKDYVLLVENIFILLVGIFKIYYLDNVFCIEFEVTSPLKKGQLCIKDIYISDPRTCNKIMPKYIEQVLLKGKEKIILKYHHV